MSNVSAIFRKFFGAPSGAASAVDSHGAASDRQNSAAHRQRLAEAGRSPRMSLHDCCREEPSSETCTQAISGLHDAALLPNETLACDEPTKTAYRPANALDLEDSSDREVTRLLTPSVISRLIDVSTRDVAKRLVDVSYCDTNIADAPLGLAPSAKAPLYDLACDGDLTQPCKTRLGAVDLGKLTQELREDFDSQLGPRGRLAQYSAATKGYYFRSLLTEYVTALYNAQLHSRAGAELTRTEARVTDDSDKRSRQVQFREQRSGIEAFIQDCDSVLRRAVSASSVGDGLSDAFKLVYGLKPRQDYRARDASAQRHTEQRWLDHTPSDARLAIAVEKVNAYRLARGATLAAIADENTSVVAWSADESSATSAPTKSLAATPNSELDVNIAIRVITSIHGFPRPRRAVTADDITWRPQEIEALVAQRLTEIFDIQSVGSRCKRRLDDAERLAIGRGKTSRMRGEIDEGVAAPDVLACILRAGGLVVVSRDSHGRKGTPRVMEYHCRGRWSLAAARRQLALRASTDLAMFGNLAALCGVRGEISSVDRVMLYSFGSLDSDTDINSIQFWIEYDECGLPANHRVVSGNVSDMFATMGTPDWSARSRVNPNIPNELVERLYINSIHRDHGPAVERLGQQGLLWPSWREMLRPRV